MQEYNLTICVVKLFVYLSILIITLWCLLIYSQKGIKHNGESQPTLLDSDYTEDNMTGNGKFNLILLPERINKNGNKNEFIQDFDIFVKLNEPDEMDEEKLFENVRDWENYLAMCKRLGEQYLLSNSNLSYEQTLDFDYLIKEQLLEELILCYKCSHSYWPKFSQRYEKFINQDPSQYYHRNNHQSKDNVNGIKFGNKKTLQSISRAESLIQDLCLYNRWFSKEFINSFRTPLTQILPPANAEKLKDWECP